MDCNNRVTPTIDWQDQQSHTRWSPIYVLLAEIDTNYLPQLVYIMLITYELYDIAVGIDPTI